MDINRRLEKELQGPSIITFDFIEKYIEYFVKKERLRRYYKGINENPTEEFKKLNFLMAYNEKDYKITIDYDKVIKSIIETTYLKDKNYDFSADDIRFINAIFIFYLTHELIHIKQRKMRKRVVKGVEEVVVSDSLLAHDRYYEFYKENPLKFITEHHANALASLEVSDLYYKLRVFEDENIEREFNKFLASTLLSNYRVDLSSVSQCPARIFYSMFKEKNKFYVLERQAGKNSYTRIVSGMPISLGLYKKLSKIKTKKGPRCNIKRLVLNGRYYE